MNEKTGTIKYEKGDYCYDISPLFIDEEGRLKMPVLLTPRGQFFSLPLSSIEKNILRDEIAEYQEEK
ncbi:MAG TPA: hypothetical protein ENG95_05890 [Nitrospirae bacterium]|nr:hypothetical protein [Nitrospirota bacterium]